MQLHHETRPDGTEALRLAGELTIYHAAELQAALLPLADAQANNARDLVLELSGVTDIDSAGIQLLLATRRSLGAHGATLRLAGCGGAVGEALVLYGMADAFAAASVTAAVA
jgi:anti-anti-sigma factor